MTQATQEAAINAGTYKRLLIQNRVELEAAQARLAEKRKPVDEAIADLNAQFELENYNTLTQINEAQEAIDQYDKGLRTIAIDHFKATNEKRFDADISVRVTTKLQYEAEKAVAWAEQNAPIMIVKSVDKKAFESLPSTPSLDFVEVIETPSAVIAKEFTDL